MTPQAKHVALVGFMGAGKSTVAAQVGRLTGRPVVDLDEEIERRVGPISEFFERYGEAAFREGEVTTFAAATEGDPKVLALGGGAITSSEVRELLRKRAVTVWLDVAADLCWQRAKDSDRPLAQDETTFRRL